MFEEFRLETLEVGEFVGIWFMNGSLDKVGSK
jgi:hypothetical protein